MITSIQQWGNSLGLRIPVSFIKDLHLHKSSKVNLAIENGRLTIKPLKTIRYNLSSLVAKIKPDNVHSAVETGRAKGQEAW